MVVVKIKGPEGIARVLSSEPGMTFLVDKFTNGVRGMVAHVRDYRFPSPTQAYQIWSIPAEGYEIVAGNPFSS